MKSEKRALAAGDAIRDLIDHFNGRAYTARLRGKHKRAAEYACAAQAIEGAADAIWCACLMVDNPEKQGHAMNLRAIPKPQRPLVSSKLRQSARGIIFSAPIVRALLSGAKTQTRRLLKPQPPDGYRPVGIYAPGLTAVFNPAGRDHRGDPDQDFAVRLPYTLGDRLWVRETWGHDAPDIDTCRLGVESDGMRYGPYYMADGRWADNHTIRKISSIHMPRWASRLTLLVTEVRVQRLQEISASDAAAEGIRYDDGGYETTWFTPADRDRKRIADFAALWDSIHGPGAWTQNPWVAAIRFEPIRANIDEVTA